ncbi:1-phosphatidylinositol 4-kinase STT4 [Spizellomyces punctatus DAOM BR117]|uniref:1-phosphatidylinositol 4-kinase n=1 Tax=Spizellomyces punctatus (strain DAOM BR117) TaxID=645134 RepID=A0A0L0HM20_SPIPD|nr:1-phosphatidylinositol 4-kinase STT4 [Spizellomyces punctatus DAOM BR117]KND02142.1 hypothetical protein SPPG_02635 [Spizellomyces punctatus DAOM BR117]|eukprot:XP_016610181.1 hypothetical protein SPPG_02635 [Spizellomyces punctatus DAOM BR117]
MFYNLEDEISSVSLLSEAAEVVASVPAAGLEDLTDFMALCSPSVADYYTGRRSAKPYVDDLAAYFRDPGFTGLLEYLIMSEGVCREVLLPLCLDCIDILSALSSEEMAKIDDYEMVENFIYEIVSRLLLLADKFADARAALNESIWEWSNGFVNLIIRNQSPWKLRAGVVSIMGVFNALKTAPVKPQLPFLTNFLEIANRLLDFEQLKAIDKAARATENGALKYPEQRYEALDVIASLFAYAQHLLLDTLEVHRLDATPSTATWETVCQGKLCSLVTDSQSRAAIRSLYDVCWRSYRRQTSNEQCDEGDMLGTLLPVVVQSAVLCSVHVDRLEEDLFVHLTAILEEKDPHFVRNAGAEVFVVALEGLGVLTENFPAMRGKILDTLLAFIRNPAPAFLQWADDHAATAAMRHCASAMLLRNLQAAGKETITVAVLDKCVDTMRGIMVEGGTVNPWSSAWEKGLAQQNCAVAVATIARILGKQEILKVLTIAFEGSLNDPKFPSHDLIWESLGNMGLTCEPDVFHLVLSTLSRQLSPKSTEVRHTLARGAAKSPVFSGIYLQQVLTSFTEKAMRISKQTANIVAELYDIAWIAKVICDEEHIQLADEKSGRIRTLSRDFWLCAVIYVMKSDGSWPKGWPAILRQIAVKSPVMTLAPHERFLEADLRAHSVLEKSFTDETQQRVRGNLVQAFPDQASNIKLLSFAKCAYLLAVRELEVLRGQRADVKAMLEYLTDDRLYNDEAYGLLHCIGDEVVSTFLKKCVEKKEEGRIEIERHIVELLYTAASRLDRARMFAVKTIYKMLAMFPWLLWNRKAVYLMLDMVQCLDTKFQLDLDRRKLLRAKIGMELTFLNDSDIYGASKAFSDFCARWMTLAIQHSSSETMGMLQGYLVDLHTNFPELGLGDKSDLMLLLGRFCSSDDIISSIIRSVGKQALYYGEVRGMLMVLNPSGPGRSQKNPFEKISKHLRADLRAVVTHSYDPDFAVKLHPILHRAAALVLLNDQGEDETLELICWTPVTVFTPAVMDMTISVWGWLMLSRPELAPRIMAHMVAVWETTAYERKGLYSPHYKSANPFYAKMTYTSSKKPADEAHRVVHLSWIRFLLDRFKSARVQSEDHVKFYAKLYQIAHEHASSIRFSWYIREPYFLLLTLGAQIAEHLGVKGDPSAYTMWTNVLDDALKWFEVPASFGTIEKRELQILVDFHAAIKAFRPGGHSPAVLNGVAGKFIRTAWLTAAPSGRVHLADAQNLLLLLLENEIHRLATWLNPVDDKKMGLPELPQTSERAVNWPSMIRIAWSISPRIAIQMGNRFSHAGEHLDSSLVALCYASPASVLDVPEALPHILKNAASLVSDHQLRYILHWTAVPPITGVSLLGQQYKMQPWILQYAVRVLEHFPVDHVFFYIPQMVQALRYDTVGYIEHFILLAAKTSQHFAHQIIWNMNANMYKFNKEGQADAPDSLKPTLERVQNKIINSLSGSDKDFYEREFRFFTEITGISGKLKPLVESGATKAAKKVKIDEEMAKIVVDVGVYLPTNPESIVVDIDYKSGRPLQSHAKAPFMATFKVKNAEDNRTGKSSDDSVVKQDTTRWMSSIFKVGDDCRQDVLALQLISIFKSIFSKAGLDLYLFPYRVVATAPGCGVIEVIPNSTSRDMMGREQVNSLYDWFIASFGKEDCVSFRKAQSEFIKSLAAYSLILFILQIKDRHNGNIMFDNSGHMVHIDFGFMLSIAPGGGILEAAPFKLTTEMVQVLGGDVNAPQYRLFSELCVKAYLACRPYAEEITQMVSLMMESGLPCFKGDVTIRKLKERFQLDKTERQAAEFMMTCIRQSHENTRSGLYDRFQYLQNGIPY